MIKLLILSSIYGLTNAECPNGCSSHGKCTAYDMCLCYRNWMANDCSERICQFGLAHVDTPKGDLDSSSGELTGPDVPVARYSEMYPYGTTEQFPDMEGLDNTAHYYMECSNKGICDRESGTCECFPGYEGSACQRASCPGGPGAGACSGHGTCQTIRQIANADNNNIYELWDKHASMGCVCDAGYYGPDCSMRECKYGADPLYYDDNSNIRYSNWTIEFSHNGGATKTYAGTWAIRFFDHFGEDWETEPLNADASCAEIITALENIPNDVIPDGSVRCQKYAADVISSSVNDNTVSVGAAGVFSAIGSYWVKYKYGLLFRENPGYLKEIEVNRYLDGFRPTLYTDETTDTMRIAVYANGFSGEDIDIVPDECENVLVRFSQYTPAVGAPDIAAGFVVSGSVVINPVVLDFETPSVMIPLLKRCLGDADNLAGDSDMADEVYNWDYGTEQNPHMVKFIEATDNIFSKFCKSVNDHAFLDSALTSAVGHGPSWCFERAPAGFYAPLIYRTKGTTSGPNSVADGYFTVYSNAFLDYDVNTYFRVFTTTGYLNRVRADGEVFTRQSTDNDWNTLYGDTVYTYNKGKTYWDATNVPTSFFSGAIAKRHNDATLATSDNPFWQGNFDCETSPSRSITQEDCLQKGDYVMFFSVENTDLNLAKQPKYHNIYRVEKISIEYPLVDTIASGIEEPYRNRIVLDRHVNFDAPTRIASTAASTSLVNEVRYRAYKFYPPVQEIRYVDECSGRGLCNAAEGLCECFAGYTNDDCSVQNAAAA